VTPEAEGRPIKTRAGSFAFAAAVLAALWALLILAVGSPDGTSHQELALPPGGITLAPGAVLELPLQLPGPAAEFRLMVRCQQRAPCVHLRVTGGAGSSARLPDGYDGGRPYFRLHRFEDNVGLLRLTNAGPEPLTVVRASVRNFTANGDNPPRFVVFLDETATLPYSWMARLGLLIAGLGLQALGLRAWGVGRDVTLLSPRALAVAAPPVLGLGAALAVRRGGGALALPWDSFLLLAGLGLGARLAFDYAPRLLRWALRMWRTGALARAARRCLAILPALFPALVLFVYLPLGIYLPNQADFNYRAWILFPFGIATVTWTVLAVGVSLLWPARRDAWEKGCFFLGLLVLLLDLVTPVEIDVLDGRAIAEVLRVPPAAVWIQGAVALAVLLFALTVKWAQIRPLAQLVSLGLLVAQVVTFTVRVAPETRWSSGVQSQPGWSGPPPLPSQNGNIYQVVLDAFSSQVLPEILDAEPELRSLLAGFTFFPNARANMLDTTESMPSFMTGSFFPPKAPGMSDLEWWREVVPRWRLQCSSDGILRHAWEQGYTVTQYVPRMEWCPHHKTSHFRVGADLQGSGKAVAGMADLWLLKLAPAPWKPAVFDGLDQGLFERLLREPSEIEWGYWSIAHMTQLLEEEARRPDHGQYVWAHFGTPHPPSVVDANCGYRGRRWRGDDEGGYRDQAVCALRLAGRLIEALRRLQRFDAATIIIHGDHGVGWVEAQTPFNRMPEWLETRLDAASYQPGRGRETNSRSLALLLVKRPRSAREPLRVDDRLVSLVDLPQTLYELHGWPARSLEGRSLFAPALPTGSESHLFVHFPGRKMPDDAKRDWHLVFNGATWRIAPDYPTRIR
jgi:hypothetical protein